MKYFDKALDPELEALLESGRIIRPIEDVVRARALARARATIASASSAAEPPSSMRPLTSRSRIRRVAFAATVTLAIGAGAAAAVLGTRGPDHVPLSVATRSPAAPPACVVACEPGPAPSVASSEPRPIAKPRRPGPRHNALDSYAGEVDLLQRAQAAYAGGDFTSALVVVTEHGRRFPHGRLCEEREALRVRSLVGSGHTDEARRAVGAFGERFPRSVLLLSLRETTRTRD